MGPLSPEVMDSTVRVGVSIKDIPSYIPPSQPDARSRKPTKNQRYQISMPSIPQGKVCTFDIVPTLMQLRYEDHDLLSLEDVTKDPYLPMVSVECALIEQIPHDWARGFEKAGLLGLINTPHIGRPTEVNACVKQLFACFHGGYLWPYEPVAVTVELISAITGLPKDGTNPS